MTIICPSIRAPIRARGFIYLFFSAAVTISGAARAQEPADIDISDPNVTVDLSVLDDNGTGRAAVPSGLLARPGGLRLLAPGIRPPRSKLYIRPQGMTKRGGLKLPFHATAKKTARKKPLRKETKPPAGIAKSAPPPPMIAPPPVPAAKKKAPKTPPEQITAAPPPPPALKPMKAETKVKAKKKPIKTAAIAPRKLVPAPKVKKEAKNKPARSGPPKAVAEIPVPAPARVKAPEKPIKKAEPKKETASLPPPKATAARGTALKVVFAATTSKLPNPVKAKLNELVGMMKKKGELRIQLLAYAGGKSLSSSKARRLSLSRALSVRSYLIGKGIRSTRIDVRALGNKTTEEPLNRVDINVIAR